MRASSSIQLILALLLAGAVWAVEAKTATKLGSFSWRNAADWFGGFSAIHISKGGRQMVAMSDRATLVTAQIDRSGDTIAGVRVTGHWPLFSSTGRILVGKAADSEGIALAPDGGFYISFEGVPRVAHYPAPVAGGRGRPARRRGSVSIRHRRL